MSDVRGMKRLVYNLRWGWANGRRAPLIALALAGLGVVLTWTVAPLFGPALTLLCVVFSIGWGEGHNRGHKQGHLCAVEAQIAFMEQVCAAAEEQLAPHHPQREAAHAQLVELRRHRDWLQSS